MPICPNCGIAVRPALGKIRKLWDFTVDVSDSSDPQDADYRAVNQDDVLAFMESEMNNGGHAWAAFTEWVLAQKVAA